MKLIIISLFFINTANAQTIFSPQLNNCKNHPFGGTVWDCKDFTIDVATQNVSYTDVPFLKTIPYKNTVLLFKGCPSTDTNCLLANPIEIYFDSESSVPHDRNVPYSGLTYKIATKTASSTSVVDKDYTVSIISNITLPNIQLISWYIDETFDKIDTFLTIKNFFSDLQTPQQVLDQVRSLTTNDQSQLSRSILRLERRITQVSDPISKEHLTTELNRLIQLKESLSSLLTTNCEENCDVLLEVNQLLNTRILDFKTNLNNTALFLIAEVDRLKSVNLELSMQIQSLADELNFTLQDLNGEL